MCARARTAQLGAAVARRHVVPVLRRGAGTAPTAGTTVGQGPLRVTHAHDTHANFLPPSAVRTARARDARVIKRLQWRTLEKHVSEYRTSIVSARYVGDK